MKEIVGESLAERLVEWGVNTIFGLPGDGINGLMARAARSPAPAGPSVDCPECRRRFGSSRSGSDGPDRPRWIPVRNSDGRLKNGRDVRPLRPIYQAFALVRGTQ